MKSYAGVRDLLGKRNFSRSLVTQRLDCKDIFITNNEKEK